MFKHDKKLLEMVRVERPNPNYAALLQEQIGGPHGELKAGLQYLAQSFRIQDPAIRDIFLDIAAEELSHLEMVCTAVNLLNGHEPQAMNATIGTVQAHVATGLNPFYSNASGQVWTAAYIEATGDLPADLLSNIAAEQRAKVVYEYLHRQIADRYVRQMIDFLLNREEAHNTLFRECFQKVQGTSSTKDWGVDKDARLFFNLSTPGRYVGSSLQNPQPPSFNEPQVPPQ
ncbi:MAG: manganese catalase family protein [Thermanaeromonas sp.]|uniref:manganese catalase family protein n=1 Tax=Thermanaeromonas sp. TaxID=2003697 RepID=UPI002440CD7F|nr:manganese catalase family protein [Thermanaeromonas sp.]MCG0278499.1 manganese catalase family protein [Thermanaeromonas sp.]